ncbi:MAG TPA: polysaccharide biosynthesis/export family protein [Blastocatellia bacterium]|nr:polysaccharide biosynthesis/export family protein [Blastocatellia bacterium]
MAKRIVSLTLSALIIMYAAVPIGAAQARAQAVSASVDESRPRTVAQKGDGAVADTRPLNPGEAASSTDEAAVQSQISAVYRGFYNSYRLGPGDIVAIYIDKHPEDSVQRVTVSPVGRVYFPLLGDVSVVGKTLPQLQEYLTNSVAEFIREPRVTLALLEAQSAKVGVLGDVKTPGLMVMTRPLRVLDAITLAGGILDTGSSSVSILRQYEDGRVQVFTADVKKILKGKANPEENAYLRSGDTVIVHGNLFKTMTRISSLVGVTSLVTFLTRGGR